MKLHWWILLGMVAGVFVGGVFQLALEARPTTGLELAPAEGRLRVTKLAPDGPGARVGIGVGDLVLSGRVPGAAPVQFQGSLPAFREWLDRFEHGQRVLLLLESGREAEIALDLDPDSPRSRWLAPFVGIADVFMRLLQMLIVPIILTSIVSGVSGISGGREFGRLGAKTLGYYLTTSLFAASVGLLFVNLVQPGVGAELGLAVPDRFDPGQGRSFADVLVRMVPKNVFGAFSENGEMLQIIFFAIIFGFFVGRTPAPHGTRIQELFQAAFHVMMGVAGMALKVIPIGVFALMVKVVGATGFEIFKPLLTYMLMVTGGLLFHALVVLPLLLRFVGRISPFAWFKAMSPALMTAVTTSSSSITLPVTLECLEHRGKVSNKITSFVAPLGATVNMDGTALYECAGVIFLSQYYASAGGFHLDLGTQLFVVFTALLASIGAAGIPSAGLVMMLAILTALGLPVEGAALLLAIDRPLDMLRTAVNIWSDSCGAAIVARTEGETLLEP